MDFEKLAEGLVAFRKEAKIPRYLRNLVESGVETISLPNREVGYLVHKHRRLRRFGRSFAKDIARERVALKRYNAAVRSGNPDQLRNAGKALQDAEDAVKARFPDRFLEILKAKRDYGRKSPGISLVSDKDRATMDRVHKYVTRGYGDGYRGKLRKAKDFLFPGARLAKEKRIRKKLVSRGRLKSDSFATQDAGAAIDGIIGGAATLAGLGVLGTMGYNNRHKLKKFKPTRLKRKK